MADDLILEEHEKVENPRIKELATKVKSVAQERDLLSEEKKKIELERDLATKERDFYASFADQASLHPQAKDHKDEIKIKVLAGYTVEDATVSVLAKAGKLNIEQSKPERESAAGGSAATVTLTKTNKSIYEMTREERRQALLDAEARGDIGFS